MAFRSRKGDEKGAFFIRKPLKIVSSNSDFFWRRVEFSIFVRFMCIHNKRFSRQRWNWKRKAIFDEVSKFPIVLKIASWMRFSRWNFFFTISIAISRWEISSRITIWTNARYGLRCTIACKEIAYLQRSRSVSLAMEKTWKYRWCSVVRASILLQKLVYTPIKEIRRRCIRITGHVVNQTTMAGSVWRNWNE